MSPCGTQGIALSASSASTAEPKIWRTLPSILYQICTGATNERSRCQVLEPLDPVDSQPSLDVHLICGSASAARRAHIRLRTAFSSGEIPPAYQMLKKWLCGMESCIRWLVSSRVVYLHQSLDRSKGTSRGKIMAECRSRLKEPHVHSFQL